METYTVPSWSARRCLGELKEFLEYQNGTFSWGEALARPPLLALKATITAICATLPNKPQFGQIDGIEPTLGQVLDMLEEQLTDKQKLKPIGVFRPAWVDGMALSGCIGMVYVWPAFWGADP